MQFFWGATAAGEAEDRRALGVKETAGDAETIVF